MKAPKNKTIDLELDEGRAYFERCVRVEAPAALEAVLDRTICGDCFEVLPLLPRGCADLLIADPPYNLTKDYHGARFHRMDDEAYEEYTIRWLEAALPVLKPGGSVYICDIWFATLSEDYYFDADAVRQRRRVLAPYRQDGQPKDWEETADGRFRDTAPSNFWDDLSIPYWSMPENTAHPTQKPEKLMAKLILASCPPGGVVLDPFLGSGSSAVTAKKLGRRFLGIEQNPRYCVWCETRLELAERDPAIQGYTDGVFWERNTYALQKQKK